MFTYASEQRATVFLAPLLLLQLPELCGTTSYPFDPFIATKSQENVYFGFMQLY